jgi:DNA-binding NarL/FixJ family response regulator
MKRGRPKHPDQLTPSEWRVVNAVRHGMTNRVIARRLGISADGVNYHLVNALGKLGCRRGMRFGIARCAQRQRAGSGVKRDG